MHSFLTEAQLCQCEAADGVHIINTPQQALVVARSAQLEHSTACTAISNNEQQQQ